MLLGNQQYSKNLTLRNMEELMSHRSNLVHKIYNDIQNEAVQEIRDETDEISDYKQIQDTLEVTEDDSKYIDQINESEISFSKD